jgi:hypothetical protein
MRSTSPEEIVSLITGELADEPRPMKTANGNQT